MRTLHCEAPSSLSTALHHLCWTRVHAGPQLTERARAVARGFTPTDLSVNGLGARDLLHTAFEVNLTLAQFQRPPPAARARTDTLLPVGLPSGSSASSWQVSEGFVLHWIATPAPGVEIPAVDAAPTAFMVDLTGSHSNGTSLTWSSGVIESDASLLILPETLTHHFAQGASFGWRVRLKDGSNAWSEYATSSFDTTPPASAWQNSSWIGGGSELRGDLALPLGKSVVRARAYATGVGAFELHLNGQKVGDHILDPGEAVYVQTLLLRQFGR